MEESDELVEPLGSMLTNFLEMFSKEASGNDVGLGQQGANSASIQYKTHAEH